MRGIGKMVLLLLIIVIIAMISCSGSEIGNPKYYPGNPVSGNNELLSNQDTCTDSSAIKIIFPPNELGQ